MVKKKLSGGGGISIWPVGGISSTGGRVEQDKTTSANKMNIKFRFMLCAMPFTLVVLLEAYKAWNTLYIF